MNHANTVERYSRNNPARHWRIYSYDLNKGHDIARMVAREMYAWPGGYEMFAVTDDGGILCFDCCRAEYINIRTSYPGDGWCVVAVDSVASCDDPQHCSHCSRIIE